MTREQAKNVAKRLVEIHARGGDAASVAAKLQVKCLKLAADQSVEAAKEVNKNVADKVEDAAKKVAKEVAKIQKKVPTISKQVLEEAKKEIQNRYDVAKKYLNLPDRLR